MIDLHLHTTASDGRSSPENLVREAFEAGVRTLAVTDHDTTADLAAARTAAAGHGIGFVSGIEITAVHAGADVHVLGYYLDQDDAALQAFLETQRRDRRRRLGEMGERLRELGVPVDVDALLPAGAEAAGRAPGRPLLARALVAAGHAADVADAFARYLAMGRPAFVSRRGPAPPDVIALIAAAGGIASLAHPGKLACDDCVPAWIDAGLQAIEVFHPDHDDADVARYLAIARDHHLVVTGGSDYHGPGSGRSSGLGRVGLPADEFARLERAAGAGPRHTSS